jgi:hypothetical protein
MVPKEVVGGSEAHEMDILPAQSETNSNDRGALVVSTDQDPDPEVTREILSGQDAGTTSISPSPSYVKSIFHTDTLLDK